MEKVFIDNSRAPQGPKGSGNEESELKSMTKLKYKWVLWEQLQGEEKAQKGLVQKQYMENLQEVAEFDNLISFWQLWNTVPHANPANCFTVFDESSKKLVQEQ